MPLPVLALGLAVALPVAPQPGVARDVAYVSGATRM
jgi:hypothetical protein